jgi:hypothetical protein
VCRMREDDLNFRGAGAGMGNQKLQPFSGKEWHVTAEYEIPFGVLTGRGSMLQRGDNAAEGAFAGPAIFNDWEFTIEASVFLRATDNGNFCSAASGERSDFQQQGNSIKANQGFIASKAGAGSAGENVAAQV